MGVLRGLSLAMWSLKELVSSQAAPGQHSKTAGAEVTGFLRPGRGSHTTLLLTSATVSQSKQVTGQPSLKAWGSRLHLWRGLGFTGTATGITKGSKPHYPERQEKLLNPTKKVEKTRPTSCVLDKYFPRT